MKRILFIIVILCHALNIEAGERDSTSKSFAQTNIPNDNKIVLEFNNPAELKQWLSQNRESTFSKIYPILIALLPIFGSVYLWYLNNSRERKLRIQNQKEKRYKKLVTCVEGFTTTSKRPELRQVFVDQLNLSWIYCPDDVIKKGQRFLELMIPGGNGKTMSQNNEIEKTIGELFNAIRKDILSNKRNSITNLKAEDYKSIGIV